MIKVPRYTDEECLDALKRFKAEFGCVPKYVDLKAKRKGYPSGGCIVYRFGTWNNALKKAGLKTATIPRYTNEEYLDAFRRFEKEFGRVPRHKDFCFGREGYPAASSVVGRFGMWNEALRRAGFEITKTDRNYDDISPLLKAYEKNMSLNLEDITVKKKLLVLYDLEQFLKSKNKEWKDITVEDVIEWFKFLEEKGTFESYASKQVKPNSPVTLKTKFRILSAFLTFVFDQAEMSGKKPIIPHWTIKQIKVKCKTEKIIGRDRRKSKRRGLTEEYVNEIRNNIKSPNVEVLFSLGLNLGLRRIEYTRIKLEHVHLDESYIDIIGKGKIYRDLALTKEMKQLVEYQLALRKLNKVEHEYLFFNPVSKKPLSGYAVNKTFNELCKKTGLKNGAGKFVKWNAHEIRYTMDSFMFRRGVPINLIAQRMGHGSSLTLHYAREPLHERIRVLEEKVGIL